MPDTTSRRRRPWPEVSRTAPIRALLATLATLPKFPAAPPCAADPAQFDLYVPRETPRAALDRWRRAEEVCLNCPFLAACLPLAGSGVEGVVAGRVCGLSGLPPQPPSVLEYSGPSRSGRCRYRVDAAELRRRARAANRRRAHERQLERRGA
ncbi:hypothetical protein [Rhodococcus aetherivorans]|uniref:hypothetical protein n=1 Tax=Rhodococcus aetherivorans TaxID=191292 RepID=UPI002949F387|nr:hypothetical protein [Rhodococcus aetherivorans]MDV6291653.1 hypothetical protein [Rhodococcus aetherivorans]